MKRNVMAAALAAVVAMGLGVAAAGDEYAIDPVHSGVTFQITHLDLTSVHGRFNDFAGTLSLDPSDPSKSSVKMTIKTASIDTNNALRDAHLKNPDYFNATQYPTIEFVSTSLAPIDGGYAVKGNMTLHGETKPISFELKGGKTAEFPRGTHRIGFTARFQVKRSEFGISPRTPATVLGDDVWVDIGFEAVKKK